ncbi:hypothetical protein QYF61_019497 [Mycteria americana]|uniref:Reverse transcriptase domain-containing protein n=1 Tax=Mycteria americana TaxID=33587 RepID=A0AAN7NKC5_MYCAM|nr:hypothetical protein QYF61_019497 [Mycteria americana]
MEVNGGADIYLQPMEVNGGADIHLQPMEDPMPEQGILQAHKVILFKYRIYWNENWLNSQAQRVVISVTKTSWRQVTNSVPHESIPDSVLFNIFINGLDYGAECALSRFADDIKLGRVAGMPEGPAAIQRDLDTLEKWSDRSLMKISRRKYKVLQLGMNNPMHQNMLRVNWLESCLAEKALVVLVDTKLNMSQQCDLAANKANGGVLQAGEGGDPSPALVRPHLEYCVQFWASQYKRDVDILERVQQMATKMSKGLEHLYIGGKRRLRGYVVNAYKYLKGRCKEDRARLVSVVPSNRIRGNGHKLKQEALSEHQKTLFYCEGD